MMYDATSLDGNTAAVIRPLVPFMGNELNSSSQNTI